MDKIELLGGACFSHGPYTFYKAVRISNNRVLRLGSFFLTKLWSDADLVSIGELQLLWLDSRGPNTPLASLRLYFLPENTPDGRRDTHGEDEVLTISEKVVVRVHDLVTWLSPSLEWSWGREVSFPPTPTSSPEGSPQPQPLSESGLDFSDVERHQRDLEALTGSSTTRRSGGSATADGGSNNNNNASATANQTKVVVLSYARYCRYRSLLRRLEGSKPSWLCSSIAAALGGFTALPGTRVLFCRDTFDYPDLETHELLCNHLAPKLKGRPRRKRKKRSVSPGESSNESEASVASSAAASTSKGSTSSSGQSSSSVAGGAGAAAAAGATANNAGGGGAGNGGVGRPPSSAVRRSERKTSAEEKKFVSDVQSFMSSRNTPLGKMPLLGYRQIDLFLFYTKVQDFGGYDKVSANRLWKSIYDEMGGNTGSTSAATITRRHYERLLLPYERDQKVDDTKSKSNHSGRRIKTPSISDVSESDSAEVKREVETPPPSATDSSSSAAVTSPPLPSILSTSVPTSGSPPVTNAATVVTLTPPPEKDIKEIKLDAKQTSLMAQGKENIPLFEEKGGATIFVDKSLGQAPRSPEVIDLETETETGTRDKLIIPSFKKRKLEILREGGLEVTPVVDLDSRPSVIQPTTTAIVTTASNSALSSSSSSTTPSPSPIISTMSTSPSPMMKDDRSLNIPSYSLPPNVIPKLINVTVTPDISHMLPRQDETNSQGATLQPIRPHSANKQSTNSNGTGQASPPVNSRVINLGNSNNATLLQLYVNANVPMPHTLVAAAAAQANQRFAPPQVAGRRSPVPQKIIQSRSMYASTERTVYGNPKDIMMAPKYAPQSHSPRIPCVVTSPMVRSSSNSSGGSVETPLAGGVLDLSQKMSPGPERTYPRSNLEIMRVPVVPRPNPLNYEPRNLEALHRGTIGLASNLMKDMNSVSNNAMPGKPMQDALARKNHFMTGSSPSNLGNPGYGGGVGGGILDSRTMATNNLEITLTPTMPVQRRQQPPQQQQSPMPQQQHHLNGKYPSRLSADPITPYTPRKSMNLGSSGGTIHHPVIPNVPNLSHLNANANYSKVNHISNYQQMEMEKRKAAAEATNKEQQRRISEGDKVSLQQQHIQQRLESGSGNSKQHQSRDSDRRHSLPSVPTGFIPTIPSGRPPPAFLAHQLANSGGGGGNGSVNNAPTSPALAAAAAAAAASGKFLPIIDPMYYSALYNGLYPGPMAAPNAAAAAAAAAVAANSPFLPPEFSAYYKELLASSSMQQQQTRLAMAASQQQHQQQQQQQHAAPTSK